jgi:hypothetical protein
MWTYFMVAALAQGAFGLSALNAVLLVGTVWTTARIFRRRRQQDD